MGRPAVVADEVDRVEAHAPHAHAPATTPPSGTRRRKQGIRFGTVTVLVVGGLITFTLSVGAQSLHSSNEQRLLRQRVREAGAVVGAAVPTLQTPLASAAVLAEATGGNPEAFQGLMTPLTGAGGRFVSASLWSIGGGQARSLVTAGVAPELAAEPPATVERVLHGAVGKTDVTINNLLSARERRVGYAYAAPGATANYVVYVESAIPRNRRARVDTNSAFSDLDYALYLGKTPTPALLLASSTGGDVLSGRRATYSAPFGDSTVLLVMTPRGELGGDLLARLPLALAISGILLTLAGAFLVERLLRRRDHAEALALENDGLYRAQRSVAQALQHSLLPAVLPHIAGLELASRYVAGADDVDIGGDWYDVVTLDDGRTVFVVGDVSGRGLRAATTMAELRYAFRAYAMQGDAPETILAKVSRLISVGRDGHFATAVCGSIDVAGHRLTLANAGHPDPVLVAGADAQFVPTTIGAPLGVENRESYSAVTVSIPMGATVLAYTDGLVERRGEHLDTGRERLRLGSVDTSGSLDDQLDRILAHTIPGGSQDDTAILALRWLS